MISKETWPVLDVFCNTSPLQYLHQLGKLELLPRLFGQVHVADAVVSELAEGRKRGVSLPDIGRLPWATARAASDPQRMIPSLGRGESETIALGLETPDALVVMDDAAARKAASTAGLSVVGTIGLLLLAKERGYIGVVGAELAGLARLGFRLSERLRRYALLEAGEGDSWAPSSTR